MATLNYLVHYEKFKERTAFDILVEFGQVVRPDLNPLKKGYNKDISYYAQKDWKAFLVFYKSIKSKYDLPENKHNKMNPKYKKRKKVHFTRKSYDEWWNEKNLDGSFAYNGVTDDF